MSNLRHNFVGLSRARVQNILNCDELHYKRDANFLNKAALKPIRVRDVQMRHQVDLMVCIGKSANVSLNEKSCRYVLSVIDVFSRFTWFRAVSKKVAR